MDFNGVDLNLLAAFNALMEERNVTRAAARVNVSQPAMSAALARLRTLFGDRLFQRSAGGLLPTPRAYEVAEPIARALLQIETVFAPAAQFAPQSAKLTFSVGVSEYPAFVLLPQVLGALAQEAPGARVDVHAFTGRDEAVALLDAGKVDVAIGVAPTVQESRILSRELLRDQFVTLVRNGHRPARGKMDLDAYLAMGHVLVSPEGNKFGLVDQVLAERGLKRDVRLTLPHMSAVPAILRQTGYAATVLRRVALNSAHAGELLMFPPPVPLPDIAFHMIWHRRNDSQAAQRWLRELVGRAGAQFTPAP